MAIAKIILYKSKKLKDGTHPVVMRITHNRVRKYFVLGYSCLPEQWNEEAGHFNTRNDPKAGRVSYPDAVQSNAVLTTKQKEANRIIKSMEEDSEEFTFRVFEIRFRQLVNRKTASEYFDQWIKEYESEGQIGNAIAYTNSKSALERFRPGVTLSGVNVILLKNFEKWLRAEGLKETTISVYFRTLRSLINKAIVDGFLKDETYPFARNRNDKYKFRISKFNTKTAKRALSRDSVEKIKGLRFKKGTQIHLAHQIFLFSYYARGMNFIDMAFLKWTDIENNRIRYTRKKTGKEFNIPIRVEMEPILEYFKETCISQGGYVFPVLDDSIHKTLKQKYTRVRTVLRDVNTSLKEIATLIGQRGMKLTTYVSRHSYATVLRRAGVPAAIIGRGMGHETETVTNVYLEEIDPETIDNAEAGIL